MLQSPLASKDLKDSDERECPESSAFLGNIF